MSSAAKTIWWDAENRPITVTLGGITTTSFAYDRDGKRVKKAESDGTLVTTTSYIGNSYEVTGTSQTSAPPWWDHR